MHDRGSVNAPKQPVTVGDLRADLINRIAAVVGEDFLYPDPLKTGIWMGPGVVAARTVAQAVVDVLSVAEVLSLVPVADLVSALRAEGVLAIPDPIVRPLGTRLAYAGVQEVWDTYVKPEQEAEIPPSIEMRCLMAILRSVAKGYADRDALAEAQPFPPAGGVS